jgi:hypothetical protein
LRNLVEIGDGADDLARRFGQSSFEFGEVSG